MDTNTNLKIFDHIYKTKIKSVHLVFNPNSYQRPLLYPHKFDSLFNFLGTDKTLQECYAKQSKFKLTKPEIDEFVQLLATNNILSTDGAPNRLFSNPGSSRYWRFTVWLHLTNDCNFRCTYCFVKKTHEKMSLETLIKSVDEIAKAAVKKNVKRVTLVLGGGEPLLMFDHIKKLNEYVLKVSAKNNLSIRMSIITNGSLLNDTIAQYFKENKIIVGVSVDGAEKYHNETRVFKDGSGTFDLVKKGIELADKYKILSNISMTLNARNIKGLSEFIMFMLHLNPGIRLMLGLAKNIGDSSTNTIKSDAIIIKELKKTYKMIGDFYAETNPDFSYLYFHRLLDAVFMYEPNKAHCGAGSYYLTITHEGKLKLCPSLLEKDAMTIDPGLDIVSQATANNFLYPNGLNVDKIHKCKKCLWKYACRGGCPSERYAMGKDLLTTPSNCHIYETLIPYQVKLEGERLLANMLRSESKDAKE